MPPGAERAKQSQFQPPWRHLCETKPNLRGLGYVGKGGHRVDRLRRRRNLRNKANFRRRPHSVPSSGPRIWASSVDRNRPICYKIQLAPAWAGKKSRTREGLLAFCSVQPSLKAQGCPLRETPTLREAFIRRTATSRHKLDFLDEVAALRRARSGSRKGPSGQGDKNGNSAIEATEFLVVAEIEVPLLTGGQVCVEGLLA